MSCSQSDVMTSGRLARSNAALDQRCRLTQHSRIGFGRARGIADGGTGPAVPERRLGRP